MISGVWFQNKTMGLPLNETNGRKQTEYNVVRKSKDTTSGYNSLRQRQNRTRGGYILGVIERFPKLQLLGYWHHAYIYINGYLNKNVYWSVYNLHICRAHRPSEVENNNTLIQVYVILVHVPTQWISCLRELPL